MIPSQTSHDYPLVDQLSSVVSTQPVDTHTNERSIESKICNIKTKVFHFICNIPRYSYKGTKDAVNYTYETITSHPITAASILIAALTLSFVVVVALTIYNDKFCTNREASLPVIVALTFISAVVSVAFQAYKRTNREASHLRIAASIILIVACLAGVALASYNYKLCTNREESR